MTSLHICYISQEYPPDTGWGGIGSYTYEMAHALVNSGHRVTVISLAVCGEKIDNDNGVIVHRIRSTPRLNNLCVLWRLDKIWPGFAWAAAARLRKIHHELKVDIVEAAEGRADSLFIPYLTGIKVVVRLHLAQIFVDQLNMIKPDGTRKYKYWLEKRSILGAAAITAPSQAVADMTRQWLQMGHKRMIRVIPNPINAPSFCPNKTECSHDEIIYVGRLERRKGVHLFCSVIPSILDQFPRAIFRFIGADGSDSDGISWRQKLLQELPEIDHPRVVFEQLPRNQLVEVFNKAAICVLPSIWENFPYALLEAMSCGVPIVATKVGGIPEMVIDNITGILVPPESPSSLEYAIMTLLSKPDQRIIMGNMARQHILEHFSVEHLVPKMVTLYCDVLAT